MAKQDVRHSPNCLVYGLGASFLAFCALYVTWRRLPDPTARGAATGAQIVVAPENEDSARSGDSLDYEAEEGESSVYSPNVGPRTETKHVENSTQALLDLVDCAKCNEATPSNDRFAEIQREQASRETGRLECLEAIRKRIVHDYRPFFKDVNRVILMDVALHANLGDTVMWTAALHLTSLLGHSASHICATFQKADVLYSTLPQFPHCQLPDIVELAKDNGLILYQAGGNWGTLYRDIQEYRMQALQFFADNYTSQGFDFKIVQLPQSIDYEAEKLAEIEADDRIVNALPEGMLTLFVGQQESLDYAEAHYGSNVEKILTPDIAFVLGPLTPVTAPECDVLLLTRDDQEASDMEEREEVQSFLERSGLTFMIQDWSYTPESTEFSPTNSTGLSEVRLNEAMKTVSKGRIIVTNYMHGSVIATMVGRTVLWVDTPHEKLKRTREVAFSVSDQCSVENLRAFKFPTLLSATKAAVEYLNQERGHEIF